VRMRIGMLLGICYALFWHHEGSSSITIRSIHITGGLRYHWRMLLLYNNSMAVVSLLQLNINTRQSTSSVANTELPGVTGLRTLRLII